MVNIFPYWEAPAGSTMDFAHDVFRDRAVAVLKSAKASFRDVWLGGTGWPSNDTAVEGRNPNNLANSANAKQYFDKIGCQLLKGSGSGFYFVEGNQDALANDWPYFGLLGNDGNVLNSIDGTCTEFVAEQNVPSGVPALAGGPAPTSVPA